MCCFARPIAFKQFALFFSVIAQFVKAAGLVAVAPVSRLPLLPHVGEAVFSTFVAITRLERWSVGEAFQRSWTVLVRGNSSVLAPACQSESKSRTSSRQVQFGILQRKVAGWFCWNSGRLGSDGSTTTEVTGELLGFCAAANELQVLTARIAPLENQLQIESARAQQGEQEKRIDSDSVNNANVSWRRHGGYEGDWTTFHFERNLRTGLRRLVRTFTLARFGDDILTVRSWAALQQRIVVKTCVASQRTALYPGTDGPARHQTTALWPCSG